jgi:hypothetical protein
VVFRAPPDFAISARQKLNILPRHISLIDSYRLVVNAASVFPRAMPGSQARTRERARVSQHSRTCASSLLARVC